MKAFIFLFFILLNGCIIYDECHCEEVTIDNCAESCRATWLNSSAIEYKWEISCPVCQCHCELVNNEYSDML